MKSTNTLSQKLKLREWFVWLLLLSLPLISNSQTFSHNPPDKISPLISSKLSHKLDEEIKVVISSGSPINFIIDNEIEIFGRHKKGSDHYLDCRLTYEQIIDLARMTEIKFIELWRQPITESKQEGLDLTLNEVRFLHHKFPQLAGTGMTLSIKEHLFDTTDIDFKNRITALDFASMHTDIHATNMATVAAGGGNSSPKGKGVAWDAGISSSDFSNLFPDPDTYFIDNTISVQNHSYGTGIENYYGPESVAYDEMGERISWLVHVFSAGNVGDQTSSEGLYAGIPGWANLTGQFKQSKNTITVGATDSLHNVVTLSSRGPAYDGRIKPEVVAYGHGGSSGAAAIVSGISLLIQQIFFEAYNQLPLSSLVKAVLVNSATDIESPGPDFKSGFGSVNANKAIQAIKNHNFTHIHLNANSSRETMVAIPDGVAMGNITIAWIDPAGDLMSEKALANDIDLEIESLSTGEKWLPWIVNSLPVQDSLNLPARTGRDTLNNVEKITMTSPPAGDYVIRIIANDLRTPDQIVSLVVQYDTTGFFEWTFPTSDDHLVPGEKNTIRWNAATQESGEISFRYIGEDWEVIGNNINASLKQHIPSLPSNHGRAQLMWSSGLTTVMSDTFIVASPLEPDVVLLCSDSMIINWKNPGNANSFSVYRLGEKHLEPYVTTQDTFLVEHPIDLHNPYYAVASLYDQQEGPRSYAFDFTKQGAGCFLEDFYLLHVLNGKASFAANLSLVENINSVIFEERINNTFIAVQTLNQIDTTTLFFTSNQLKQGINYFRLRLILADGTEIVSDEERVYFNDNKAVLLFPNPVSDGEALSFLINGIDEFDILIFDIQGKEIFRFNEMESPAHLPPMNLVPGIYIYKIVSPQGDVHGKFLVY